MNNFLIAGNWKMNKNIIETGELVKAIRDENEKTDKAVEILVCPPFTSLETATAAIEDSEIKLGAQNFHYEEKGAFTGEISASMLQSANCKYVILGHSERRKVFGEDDHLINKKVLAALKNSLKPILCIGETLEERENDLTFNVLERQLKLALNDVKQSDLENITIAYEPVWAIGTGVSASPEQADEVHNWLRTFLLEKYGSHTKNIKLLYGGSLKPENAKDLLKLTNINGGLIGGASLDAEKFNSVIKTAEGLLS